MVKEISLPHGMVTIVDDEDYELVSQYKWSVMRIRKSEVYHPKHAVSYIGEDGKRHQRTQFMHTLIMNPPQGTQVDHINHDGLDNRRCNMRLATHSQNSYNTRKISRITTSKYKGIFWCKRDRRWIAKLRQNGKYLLQRSFVSEEDAARVYNEEVKKIHGEFAYLNVIGGK